MRVTLSPQARRALAALRPMGRLRADVPEPVGLPPRRVLTLPEGEQVAIRDSGGSGPVVLLLHGWGITAGVNFAALMAVLAADHRVVALDHRGHGRRSGPFGFDTAAADLRDLLDVLGVERAVLCGYSLGGSIALEFGRAYPERVAGIALQATALAYPHRIDRLMLSGLRVLLPLARLGVGRSMAARYFAGFRAGEMWPWLRWELAQAHPLDLVRAGIADLGFDFRPYVASVRGLPISVLVTTADREVPPADQRAMAEALGARVHELNADHDVFMADPERYAAAAVAQIQALTAVGGTEVSV